MMIVICFCITGRYKICQLILKLIKQTAIQAAILFHGLYLATMLMLETVGGFAPATKLVLTPLYLCSINS